MAMPQSMLRRKKRHRRQDRGGRFLPGTLMRRGYPQRCPRGRRRCCWRQIIGISHETLPTPSTLYY
jgi:hypothetical protein